MRFARPLSGVRALAVASTGATYACTSGPGQPGKLRVELSLPGIEAFFALGARLGSTYPGEPLLTWDQGSVGPGVPTPPVRWVIVSYPSGQPPILIASLSGPVSFTWRGGPGSWTLETGKSWSGWLRFGLPQGLHPAETRSAAQLGALALSMRDRASHWTRPAPRLLGFDARHEEGGVLAIWRYDRAGAMVPPCLSLARLAGYPVEIRSGVESWRAPTRDGPAAITKEPRLVAFFPAKRIPPGRAVTLGPAHEPEGPFSLADENQIASLAWANLFAWRSAESHAQASGLLSDYIVQARQFKEPHTLQRVLFGGDGSGFEQGALFAVLEAAIAHADPGEDASRPLGTSLMWRFDPYACSAGSPIGDRWLSIALALDDDPVRRSLGAMLFASSAAAKVRASWLARNGLDAEREPGAHWADPWVDGLYRPDRRLDALLSPLRVDVPGSFLAAAHPRGVRLRWRHTGRGELRLTAPGTVLVEAVAGLAEIAPAGVTGQAFAYRGSPGMAEALVLWPGAWHSVPASSAPPLAQDRR